MITYFIFDLLPVWLAKLAATARESALYRLLAAAYRWCRTLVRESFCARLWQGSERLRQDLEDSFVCRGADAVLRWLGEFVGKCFGWIAPPLCNSAIGTTLRRIPRFNFAWFYGFVFLLCYCCPGPLWRNQYGLILSFGLFGAMLIESWHADRVPLRLKDIGLWTAVFMLASVLAVVNAADRSEAIRVFCFYLTAYLLCISLVGTVNNRGRLMAILGFIYATLIITGLYAIVQRIIGVEVSASLTDLTMNAGMPAVSTPRWRIPTTTPSLSC